jgi:hypothetical protein
VSLPSGLGVGPAVDDLPQGPFCLLADESASDERAIKRNKLAELTDLADYDSQELLQVLKNLLTSLRNCEAGKYLISVVGTSPGILTPCAWFSDIPSVGTLPASFLVRLLRPDAVDHVIDGGNLDDFESPLLHDRQH